MIYNLYAMYSYIFTILFTLSPLCTFNSLLKSLVIKLVYTTFVFFLTVNLLWIFFWCLLSSILYFFPLWQADKKAWVLPPLGMYWIEIPLTPTSAPNHNQVPGQSPFLAPSRHVILAWGACPALPGDISYVSNKPLPTILVCVCVCVYVCVCCHQFQNPSQILGDLHLPSKLNIITAYPKPRHSSNAMCYCPFSAEWLSVFLPLYSIYTFAI